LYNFVQFILDHPITTTQYKMTKNGAYVSLSHCSEHQAGLSIYKIHKKLSSLTN